MTRLFVGFASALTSVASNRASRFIFLPTASLAMAPLGSCSKRRSPRRVKLWQSRRCCRTSASRFARRAPGVVVRPRMFVHASPRRIVSCHHGQNRELNMMKRLDHCNVCKLKHCFYTSGNEVCWRAPWRMYRAVRELTTTGPRDGGSPTSCI